MSTDADRHIEAKTFPYTRPRRHEWAESDESRFGIYRLGPPRTGLRGREPLQVVTCGEDDIGYTLVMLRAERDLTDADSVGILDGFTGDWIINPYGTGPAA